MSNRARKYLPTVLKSGGADSGAAPTAAMGYNLYAQAMDGLTCFEDTDSLDPCETTDLCIRWTEELGVVANSNLEATNGATFTTGGAGGKSYLAFDGVNDQYLTAGGVSTASYISVSAHMVTLALTIPTGYTSSGVIIRDASTWWDIRHMTGDVIQVRHYDGAYKTINAPFTPDTPLVVSFRHNGSALFYKINLGDWVEDVNEDPVGNRSGSAAFQISSGASDVDLYAVALGDAVADADVTSVHTYLMSQIGL